MTTDHLFNTHPLMGIEFIIKHLISDLLNALLFCLKSEKLSFCRETGLPETGPGAVLPCHSPDHFKMLVLAKL